MTRVQDLFKARGATPQAILAAANYALDVQEAGDLECDVSGAQLISSLLAKLSTSKEGITSQHLSAAALLARLVCCFGRKKSDVCKALLQSSYATSLFTLTRAAVAAAREDEILSEGSCVNISELVNGIDDAGKLNYKDTATTSAGGRVRGRVLIGEEAVPVLLEVLFLINNVQDEDVTHILPTCTLTNESLAMFIQSSPDNCSALVSAPQLNNGKALTILLQRCGNFSLQLDICEILYNCYVAAQKTQNTSTDGASGGDFLDLKAFTLSSPLKKLASRDLQEMNFPEEMRMVVMNFNKNLKSLAKVTTLSAKEIEIAGDIAHMPPGSWVDFGTSSLTLTLILNSLSGGGGGGGANGKSFSAPGVFSQEEQKLTQDVFGSQSQPENDVFDETMPAIEEIFYSEITHAELSLWSNGTAVMALSLPTLSQDLLNAGYGSSSVHNGSCRVLITFEAADLVNMCSAVPFVAAAMEQAGIPLASVRKMNGKMNGGEVADTTQRPKKVSLAVAGGMIKVSGLRNPSAAGNRPSKETVFTQVQRVKQSTNTTTNAAAPPPPPPLTAAPAPAAAAAPEGEDEEANLLVKKNAVRQWNRIKRAGAEDGAGKPEAKNNEAAAPAINQKPEPVPAARGNGKAKAKAKPSAAEPETKMKNEEDPVPAGGKGRGAGKKKAPPNKPTAAATKKAAAAAATATKAAAAAAKQQRRETKPVISEDVDPIEDSTLPSLPLKDAATQNQSPAIISEADRAVQEGDALADWMLEAAPALSPGIQSRYAASPQQGQLSPFYDSSDDEDDAAFMNNVYDKAAAEEEAVVTEAVLVARTDNKKPAAAPAPAADPYAFTTNEDLVKAVDKKSKLVAAAARKPRAVPTKHQSATTKKKTTAAAAATAAQKKKPAAKKKTAATDADDANAPGGRKQPRRAAAAQAINKTKKQLNSQSINLEDVSSDDDLDQMNINGNDDAHATGKFQGVYGNEYGPFDDAFDDGWVPGTQVPPSRLLLEDNSTESGEDEMEEALADEEYGLISQNVPPFGAECPDAGGKGGLAGLKAALAGNINNNNNTATAAAPAVAEKGENNATMAAAEVLRKRVSPCSAVKKGKGRLSNMLPIGGGTGGGTGSGGKGGKSSGVKKKVQPVVKQTPAKLQTETPAAEVGKKKRDANSEEPKTKVNAKNSKAKAALVKGAAAAAAQKKQSSTKKKAAAMIQLESNTSSDAEDQELQQEVEDVYAFTVAEKQHKKSAPVPAPVAAAKKKPPATKAAPKAKATGKKSDSAARSIWDDVDMQELLEEDEEQEDLKATAALPAVPTKHKKSAAAAVKKRNIINNKEISYDDFALNEPDEDFEIILDSESEDDDEEAAVGRRGGGGAGGGRGGKRGRRGDATALLQMLQGRLGGNGASLDSEDDDEEVEDEDDDGLGSSGFAHVQAAIAQAMAARQRKAQRARAAHVKKLEKETKGEISKVQNEVQAGVAAAEAKAAEVLAMVEEKLSENEKEIRVVQLEYETKMTELSEKQRVLAAEAERVGQEAARHVTEAKNRGKRKLHEAFAAVKGKLEEGKRRIQRAAKRAKRMPDLASLLVPLFASG